MKPPLNITTTRRLPGRPQLHRTAPGRTRTGLLLAMPLLAMLLAIPPAGCTPSQPKQIVATREGVEVSLRPERNAPRPVPSPEFNRLTPELVERSLNRLVVRHTEWTLLDWSNPKPLLTKAQTQALRDEIIARLPELPASQRLGFSFFDQYKEQLVDVEVFPAGPNLVYQFRALILRDKKNRGRGIKEINEGELFLQPNQELEQEGQLATLRDPILSAARPTFELEEKDEREMEIF